MRISSLRKFWEALHSVYVRETACSKVLLTRRLYKAQLKLRESMSAHLQNMRRTFLELEETRKVYIVLCSLENSWDVLVTGIESMQERDLTMAYLTGRLLEEKRKWLERQPGKGGENAQHRPVSTTVQDAGRVAETVNIVKKCCMCGSAEHLQRRCPEMRNRSSETRAQDYSTH
ncbi:hypothetical protein E2320_002106, partial [Naja naja]